MPKKVDEGSPEKPSSLKGDELSKKERIGEKKVKATRIKKFRPPQRPEPRSKGHWKNRAEWMELGKEEEGSL